MRPSIRRAATSAGSLGFLAIAASCREPTQVTLLLSSTVKCGELSTVDIIVSPDAKTTQDRFAGHFTTAEARSCQPPEQPGVVGTLVVTPSGGAGTILVVAGVRVGDQPIPDALSCADPEIAKRCIIARRNVTFVDHRSLSLPIELDPICVGQTCDPSSTCFRGSCVDANVTCDGADCGLVQEMPGVGDGGATESGSGDGAYDAAFDGGPFEDGSFDGGDGSTSLDGGGDGGSFPPCAPAGGGASTFAFCYEAGGGEPHGTIKAGSCDGSMPAGHCCTCTCLATHMTMSCEIANGAPMSCVLTDCHP